jgi:uncharacterized protein YggE
MSLSKTLFLVASLAFGSLGCAAGSAQSAGAGHPYRDSVVVVGVGKVHAKPDVARINIGIEARAATVAAASKQNTEQMTRLIDTLKAGQIAERDIQTSNYSITFEHPKETPPPPVPMGAPRPQASQAPQYRVANTVTVRVRDLARVGPILDMAVAAGANNVWGVSFEREDMTSVESQMRAKAVADAKARAAELAKLNDLTLGEVISVSEVVGQSSIRSPMPMAAEYSKGSPIESGELSFQGQIELTYAIKK